VCRENAWIQCTARGVTFIYISVAVDAMPERLTGAKPVDFVAGNCVCRVARTAAGAVGAKHAGRTDWAKTKKQQTNSLMSSDLQYWLRQRIKISCYVFEKRYSNKSKYWKFSFI